MDNSKARCSAFDKAVNLLAFKDRSVKELGDKLKDKGYDSEEIDKALDKLSYYGYLNDANYALSYIKDNASKKGKRLILMELQEKGIDKNVINDAMDDYIEETDIDELSIISNIMKRRFTNVDLNDEKVSRRVVGYFLRRGFQYDNIRAVIRSFMISDLQ